MHDLVDELQQLRTDGDVDPAALEHALARERRTPFSLRPELLLTMYGAVLAIVAGVGLLLRANLERIGPLALLGGILAASLLCYGLALRPRLQGRERSLAHDYLLLLGALLSSAALGYAELRFRPLGARWPTHLLLLAAWHGLTAYWCNSRAVLSLALGAFLAWIGIETGLRELLRGPDALRDVAWRALGCALLLRAAATLHTAAGRWPAFHDVYEQFAVNLACWGALALVFDRSTRWLGVALLLPLLVAIAWHGMRTRRESLVLYAIGYGTLGALVLEGQLLGADQLFQLGLPTIIAAVVLLLRLRARLREFAQ